MLLVVTQDILPDLKHRQEALLRRRIIVNLIIILIGFFIFSYILESSIELLSINSSSSTHDLVDRDPQLAHLFKLIGRTQSSYQSNSSSSHALLPITAIISLRNQYYHPSGRADRAALLVRFLVKYPFIREIIIWNDQAPINIDHQDIFSRLGLKEDDNNDYRAKLPIIRIINSPGGMREMSGHIACSLATFDTCYHTDESTLSLNLDSLYTKYCESRAEAQASIVDHASPQEYVEETAYNVFQPENSLHSGLVSHLSRGSLAAKRLSTRYFQQLTSSSDHHSTPHSWPRTSASVLNDIQFSIWANRRPLKLVTLARFSLESQGISSEDMKLLDRELIRQTYRRLNETIQSSDPFLVPNLFPRALLSPGDTNKIAQEDDSEIGVASAYDDRSMLITNLAFSPLWPLAIDGDLSTCWKDLSFKKDGDFIGLNFVKSVRLSRLTVFGSHLEPQTWRLEMKADGDEHWVPSPTRPTVGQHQEPSLTSLRYDFTASTTVMAKKLRLRLSASHPAANGIHVCGWMINEDWLI